MGESCWKLFHSQEGQYQQFRCWIPSQRIYETMRWTGFHPVWYSLLQKNPSLVLILWVCRMILIPIWKNCRWCKFQNLGETILYNAPAGKQFDPWPWHPNPFALMVAGMESLVAAFALHATKRSALPSPRGHWPFSPSFLKTCWSASFWKYRKWVAGNNAHRGKGNSAVKPHYQAPRPKTTWNRSLTEWVG